MSNVDLLTAELKRLRKNPDRLEDCPALLQVLGVGDPHLARKALDRVIVDLADDLDVRVAAASMNGEGDVLARLTQAGIDLLDGLDQRNVRAYSDRGLRKIATHMLVSDAGTWAMLNLFLMQSIPGKVLIWFFMGVREQLYSAKLPWVLINGEAIELRGEIVQGNDSLYRWKRFLAFEGTVNEFELFEMWWRTPTPPALHVTSCTVDPDIAWSTWQHQARVSAELRRPTP